MRKSYLLLLLICINFSLLVAQNVDSTWPLDDDYPQQNGSLGQSPIENSFLRISDPGYSLSSNNLPSNDIRFQIPIFYDDEGESNDYMKSCTLKYIVSGSNPIDLMYLANNTSLNNDFAVDDNVSGEGSGYADGNNGKNGQFSFSFPNNPEIDEVWEYGNMKSDNIANIAQDENDDWYYLNLLWTPPASMARENIFPPVMFDLEINFEDNDAGYFEFNAYYGDDNTPGPDNQISSFVYNKERSENYVTSSTTPSDYYLHYNISETTNPLDCNNQNTHWYLWNSVLPEMNTEPLEDIIYDGSWTQEESINEWGITNSEIKIPYAPGLSSSYKIYYDELNTFCYESAWINGSSSPDSFASTDAIYDPINTSDSLTANDDYSITVSWDKGTHIPDTMIYYKVWKKEGLNNDAANTNVWTEVYLQFHPDNSQITDENRQGFFEAEQPIDYQFNWQSFKDYNVAPGIRYSYKVQTHTQQDRFDSNSSSPGIISSVFAKDFSYVSNIIVDNKFGSDCKLKIDWLEIENEDHIDDVSYSVFENVSGNLVFISNVSTNSIVIDLSNKQNNASLNYRIYTNATLNGIEHQSIGYTLVDANKINLPTQVTINSAEYDGSSIELKWNSLHGDPSVENISIYRDGQLLSEEVNEIYSASFSNTTSTSEQVFLDNTNLSDCTPYNYIIHTSSCNEFTIGNEKNTIINADVNGTFFDKSLEVSKGYYADKVLLNWENNNNALIEEFEVERRVLHGNQSWAKIFQSNNETHSFVDEYADAALLYEYRVKANFPPCDLASEEFITKESVPEVGFRMPEGVVSGHVEYEGGNNVENIKVSVQSTSTPINKSIYFDGTDDFIDISSYSESLSKFDSSSFTFGAWINFIDINGDDCIFSIHDSLGNNKVLLLMRYDTLLVQADGESHHYLLPAPSNFIDNWNHYAFSYSSDNHLFKCYLNGNILQSESSNLEFQLDIVAEDKISIGQEYDGLDKSQFIYGYMDEIQVYNRQLSDTEITENYNRYISKQTDGLLAYYHCDEGMGNKLYDISKNENAFNKNNASLNGTMFFSDSIPSPNHVGNIGFTDENGNYIIEAVRYTGSGNNFTVTPMAVLPYYQSVHEFEPSQRVVSISDGSLAVDGQNFTDVSSFKVTGEVYFHDLHDYNNNDTLQEKGICPVKDAMIKIDGEPVIKNGNVIITDSNGQFEIEVPIGEHRISIEKQGHTFSSGYYPSEDGVENFQQDKSGLLFVDNTTIQVKGRVVGGLLEAEKELGMGLSINNIGQATFRFDSQNGLDLLGVTTSSETGEYTSELLPIKYIISDFSVATNPSIAQYDEFQAFDVLDLSVIPQLTNVYDTTFAADNTISSIDSASYHYNESFIYRAVPSIRVLNSTKENLFTAEESLIIGDATIDNLDNFVHPIFKQAQKYESYIKIEETYKNFDVNLNTPVVDRIPVKNGQLSIVNNLAADPSEKTILLNDIDGDTLYDFRAGIPNLQIDNANPNYSFSKTWNISFETGPHTGPHTVSWLPNGNTYRGIVFGAKSEGTNFITQGPQVVSHILRDPPGSASFASYESGSATSTSLAVSTSLGASYGMNNEVNLGPEFTVGLGYATKVDIDATAGSSLSVNASIGHNGEYVETNTFTSSFSTNADDEYQGMWMDVYMGRSMNMNFGISTNLTLIDTVTCNTNLPAIECVGDTINGYRIGRQKGFFAVPGGYGTEFYYTQHEIVKALIPELEYLRNDILLTDTSRYTNVSTANYGKDNDDAIWASEAVNTDSLKVINNAGPSYDFTSSADTAQVDSVRWYNQQIRLWEQAVARNEKLKLDADPVTTGSTNISFDGGVGDITYAYENGNSDSNAITWEASISNEWSTEVGASAGGIGVTLGTSIGVSLNHTGSHTWSDETNTAVGFTLSDGGLDDKYTIDILDDGTAGNGKVFKVKGGRTSCPYFDGEQTLYWLPGAELSAATIQMEQPTISISPSTLSNVPEDEPAVFNLSLGNNNPLGYVQEYSLKVVEEHNSQGAIIEIDGLSPNRSYLVPAGTSINKVLTIQKGPETLDYVDIMLVFHSSCQYDPTNNNDNIGDTVLLSVSFLAGCTDIEISDPDPNWVVNTDNQLDGETTLDVLLSDYNYNYYSLDNIKMQYKPTAGSNWVNVETYHKEVDSLSTEEAIPDDQSFISLKWNLTDLPDGDYDIRSITDCSLATEQTSPSSGHVDRVRPDNFGTPSPADGVLDPNDEIQINFNENINEAILGYPNFSINGVLNGSEIRHDASLYFNGTDEMTIPTGMNLQNKPFTIEMWVNAQNSGTLFSQGYTDGDQMSLAINADSKLELSISGETVSSNTTLDSNTWKHISVIYNSNQVDFLIDGVLQNVLDGGLELLADYKGEGSINVGENFSGNIHELRVWKQSKDSGDIYAQMLKTQSGKEPNLLGYWAMDELEGNPKDKARARHANTTATWQVNPGGMAYHFEASSEEYLSVNMSDLSLRNDQDFTLELWFKANGGNQTILTNGSTASNPEFPEVLFGNSSGLTIRTNTSGNIEVLSNSVTLTSTANYSDSNWHHLALVKNDKSVTTIYIDYVEAASASSDLFKGFGGDKLTLGALATSTSMNTNYSEFLDGSIDEFRIWNKARSLSQITRDARAKLNGDNKGLVAYYPFETFTLNAFNQYETTSTINDQHSDTAIYASHHLTGTGTYNGSDKPVIRMARSVESVNFTYASNGDRVILSITDELSRVEGCILDIEVENVLDLYGNQMSSPITWTAYINQNQLIWDEQLIQKEKILGESMTFEIDIINQGGSLEQFEISNLPIWLTANPSEGILDPSTHTSIEFVVNEDLFIGDYNEDIMLTGNNEYAERLELQVNVEALSPTYLLDPSNFEYTMNFMGKVSVDGIRSRDEKDILFAFVGDELRGATELIYIEDYDAYFVFFSVYSNNALNDSIEFRLWDASEGKIQAQIMLNEASSISFEDQVVVGSFNELIHFEATNMLRQEIALNTGWNWVSFNLDSEDGASPNHLMIPTVTSSLTEINISNFKSQSAFALYVEGMDQNWFGSLTELSVEDMFMLKISEKDTIVYEGQAVLPFETPISISSGWNWIGYLGQRMLAINDALSSLNPTSGDVVKSKTAFSMYANESLGWLGSLNNMQGGKGYMLRSNNSGALIYPESSMYGGSQFRMDNNKYSHNLWKVDHSRYENSMSFVARIEHPDYEKPQTNNLLGVFSGLNCVGNITAIEINTEESLYFITVHGNDGDELRFDYLDVERDKVYRAENVVEFESDKLIGTIDNPYPININVEAQDLAVFFDLSIYPNPFSTVFDLSFTLDESVKVEIQLYDVMGRFVKTISKSLMNTGTHKLQIEGENLAKGVYFIEVIVGEDLYKKMIVKS